MRESRRRHEGWAPKPADHRQESSPDGRVMETVPVDRGQGFFPSAKWSEARGVDEVMKLL